MFKKLFLLGACLALALSVAAPATVQAAGIRGTAHEHAASGGACAACHLPHGAQGKRLWVVSTAPATNVRGQVAPLCASCHDTSGGMKDDYGTAFHANPDNVSHTWVFGNQSHGVLLSTAAANVPRMTYFSELPYHKTGTNTLGAIECTTCHDVHNNDPGRQPFLRKSMGILCATCHGLRQYNSTTITGWAQGNYANIGTLTNWGAANMQRTNPGSHPVGLDITGSWINTNAPITIWRGLKLPYSGSPGFWTTGGHLTGGVTGGVACVTCHAVHGVRPDHKGSLTPINGNLEDAQGMMTGYFNMLTINQVANMTDALNGRSIANGHLGRNALCSGCHIGTIPSALYAATSSTSGRTWANPGATAFGHPVDDMRIQANWVANGAAWPTASLNWPVGSATGASISNPNVICESCHVPHAAANGAGTRRIDLAVAPASIGSNMYMLRGRQTDVCYACHTDSLNKHHPVGKRYNSVGVPYLSGVRPSAMDTLECGSCHGGNGAHNWLGRGAVGLDTRWKPTDNGRGTQAAETFVTTASLTCMDCHAGMLGVVRGNKSPTLGANFDTQYSPAGMTETYTFLGKGSHVMGRIGGGGNYVRLTAATGAGYWASLGARLGNVYSGTNTWGAGYGGVGGWSRFGGYSVANPVLVCESCHELQPTRNSSTHLLLGYYAEEPGPSIASTRSQFCEGCHMPPGTHQQTGDIVTRTGLALNTTIAADRPWLVTPTDTNVVLSAGNRLTCDTCHQPHDAASESATFIIDTTPAIMGTIGASFVANNQAVYGSYIAGFWPTIQLDKGGDHSRFCRQCHQY